MPQRFPEALHGGSNCARCLGSECPATVWSQPNDQRIHSRAAAGGDVTRLEKLPQLLNVLRRRRWPEIGPRPGAPGTAEDGASHPPLPARHWPAWAERPGLQGEHALHILQVE